MDIIKKIYLFVSIAVLWGCTGGQSIETGPEETVSAFNMAMVQGRFGEAKALCDTLMMDSYLQGFSDGWAKAMSSDSSTAAAAHAILSGISTTVTSVEKDGDKRSVCYTVEIPGHNPAKSRRAVLRKEEGEWIIETVTENN